MSTHPIIADRDLGQLRSPTPQTKRQKREIARAVRHFVILEKLGYNPSLQCWCGDSLPLNYRQDNMTMQLNVFLDQHEGCSAPEVAH